MHYLATHWSIHGDVLSAIRTEVFVQEQQVPAADEWDGKDADALHFVAQTAEGIAIGCARLLVEDELLHIGRVALLAAWRQQGIGHQLMQFVLRWCITNYPDNRIYLHAQTSRIAFYERLGFKVTGEVFMDAGIPHIEMWFYTERSAL